MFFTLWGAGKPAQLLDRAKSDPISLAESAIDSTSLGHAHFCARDDLLDLLCRPGGPILFPCIYDWKPDECEDRSLRMNLRALHRFA